MTNKNDKLEQAKDQLYDSFNQLKKLNLINLLLDTLNFYAKSPFVLFLAALIPLALSVVLETFIFSYFVSNIISFSTILAILFVSLAIFLAFIFYCIAQLSVIQVTYKIFQNVTVDLMNVFDRIIENLKVFLQMVKKYLDYAWGWIPLALYAIQLIVLYAGFSANSSVIIALMISILSISPIVYLIYFVLLFKKIMQASACFFMLMKANDLNTEKALKTSIGLIEGNELVTFFIYLIIGLLVGLLSFLLNMLLGPFFAPLSWASSNVGTNAFNVLINATLIPYATIFVANYYERIKDI